MLNYQRVCFSFFLETGTSRKLCPKGSTGSTSEWHLCQMPGMVCFCWFHLSWHGCDPPIDSWFSFKKMLGGSIFILTLHVPTSISHPFLYATFWLFVSRWFLSTPWWSPGWARRGSSFNACTPPRRRLEITVGNLSDVAVKWPNDALITARSAIM
jgi:hypothetical protein